MKIAVQIKPSHFELNNLHLQTLFEKLSSLHQRGVRLQIIIGCDPVHQDDLNRFLNESVEDQIRNQIRFIEQVNTIFYIIDDVKILIKIVDPLTGDYNFTSVTIWEPIFVDLFKDKFAILWASYVKTTFDDRPH